MPMQVLDIIENAQSGAAFANLAQSCGITEEQARAAAAVIVPELAHAIERNTLSRAGLADLVSALGHGHREAILEAPEIWQDQRVLADGQAVAVHILGSEARAAALSARAARAAGLSEGLVKMLLPILAQMLMGAIARYARGGLGDILSKLPIPGGGRGATDRDTGGFETGGRMGDGRGFELPKVELPQGGYPLPPIGTQLPGTGEASRQGRPDLPRPTQGRDDREPWGTGVDRPHRERAPEGGYPMPPMPPSPDEPGWRSPRGDRVPQTDPLPFPLPGPQGRDPSNNPYGDLSDILRRGGQLPGGAAAGGGLWSIVRSVLGSALGFGNRGIVGWLVRGVVLRWGWKLLQRVLLGRRA